ncbi:MAG: hypothetical protein HYU36_16505 [Planctomycetes bacterium]|nr:hypothetical protein [Planctomycetota bacterium]
MAVLCKSVSLLHRQTSGKELESHGWLTPDRLVQASRFEGGLQVVANFSREPFILPGGEVLRPGSCQALR